MTHIFNAVYEGGVLRPLDDVMIPDHQVVRVVAESVEGKPPESSAPVVDPLADLVTDMGIEDFAEHFDDYRFGRRTP